jgi:hypothetical protein
MRVQVSKVDVARKAWSWEDVWEGPDQGLIAAWESGQQLAKADPELARSAGEGVLVVLPWKGGVERAIQGKKYGSLRYVAMWRGLRGETLDIDTDAGCILTCTRTGMSVQYTSDLSLMCQSV